MTQFADRVALQWVDCRRGYQVDQQTLTRLEGSGHLYSVIDPRMAASARVYALTDKGRRAIKETS